MTFKKITLVTALATTVLLSACSSNAKTEIKTYEGNEAQLIQTATDFINKSRFQEASDVADSLRTTYPFGSLRSQALIVKAYSDYRLNNYAAVDTSVKDFFTLNDPNKPVENGDYMLFLHAISTLDTNRSIFQSLFNLNRADNDITPIKTAVADFQQLEKVYPNSKYSSYIKPAMNYLVDVIAKSELNTAKFYVKYNNPQAAYKRATDLIINYPDSNYANQGLDIIRSETTKLNLDFSNEIKLLEAKLAGVIKRPLVTSMPKLDASLLVPVFTSNEAKPETK